MDGRYCRAVEKGGTAFAEFIVEGFGIEQVAIKGGKYKKQRCGECVAGCTKRYLDL